MRRVATNVYLCATVYLPRLLSSRLKEEEMPKEAHSLAGHTLKKVQQASERAAKKTRS